MSLPVMIRLVIIMKFLSWIWKGSVGTFRIFYFLLALTVILVAAYVLGGYSFLAGGIWGSDFGLALSMAAWVDQYFPHVPFWYPLAGGGVSIIHSYPVFSFYLVALLKRLTSLELIQAFRVLGFSSVFLMSLGIYVYVALRIKNQTAALIASILYLLSPIAWVWLFDWGFYADSISHMFVMPAIIFWDLFFTSFLDDMGRIRSRIYLTLTVVFVSLGFLTHFVTGLGLMVFFGFYVIGYTIKAKRKKRVFARSVLALSLVILLILGTTVFTTFPFYRYTKIASKGSVGGGSEEVFQKSRLTASLVLGFRTLTKEDHAARHISFPAVVSFFAFLGVLLSWQRARYLTLALFTIIALGLSFSPDVLYWMWRYFPRFLLGAFSKRSTLTILRFIFPTLAALGAIGIFKIPFFWAKGRIGGFVKGVFASLVGLGLIVFVLYQFGSFPTSINLPLNYGAEGVDLRNVWGATKSFCFLDDLKEECFDFKTDGCLAGNSCLGDDGCLKKLELNNIEKWCQSPLVPFFLPLGVQTWCYQAGERELTLPELCNPDQLTDVQVKSFWQKCRDNESFSSLCGLKFESLEEQFLPANWPEFAISASPKYEKKLKQVLDRISEENPLARADFSVFQGQYGMWAPYYNRDRQLSQIHIYATNSTLIRQFWAHLTGVFYSNSPFYGESADLMNNLAHWFGINYVFFNKRTDPKLFRETGWEVWDGNWKEGVLKFPEKNSLVDLSTKPTILVIGQKKVSAYIQVFRFATHGVFPYKDAFLVWGKETVDGYELSELSQFDVLLLHGYTYRNRKQADELLKNYVVGGGKVFIDTGWQYTVPDWETEEDQEALEIIPFNKLVWKDLGKTGDFILEDSEIGNEIDISQFSPLVWGDQSWSVSTSEKSDLKNWAKVVLSAEGYPLVIAGKLGKGRVIWSGMNIFPHAKRGGEFNYEEIEFLANLFSWLTEGKSGENFPVTYQREHPDKVEFTVGEDMSSDGSLLWKEAYYPDFRARLITSNQLQAISLKTYRAGPSFVLIKVPKLKTGDKIVYEYQQPLVEKIFSAISFLTFLFLLIIIVEGAFLRKKSIFLRLVQTIEKKLHYLLFEIWRKPFGWLKEGEGEETGGYG